MIVLCECGCGEVAPIAAYTCSRDGFIKGYPVRFIKYHQRKRENSPKWKGGKIITKAGYVQVLRADHPRADINGYVFEHIVVAEKALGRFLHERSEVHHFNEDKSNNCNQNLVICEDRSYHFLLHQRARAFKACGIPSALKCWICKQWEKDPHREDGKFVHKSCNKIYKANRYRASRAR